MTFKPATAGSTSGAITIAINGGGGGTVALSGVGQVNAAQLNVTPSSLNFGGTRTQSPVNACANTSNTRPAVNADR